ncbi:MAG: thermonuclease family protein [Rhizobiaceae bacterium]|jgi:micrococcal nuclease|nr:thermonuclease family protein [Rhizobiaceae bacterium]
MSLTLAGLFAATVLSCSTLVAVDGDTVRCGTERMRDMGPGAPNKSGYDAPEIGNAKCAKERLLGEQAKLRLQELLDQRGTQVEDSGKRDRYGRPLVVVRLGNGTTAGEVLMREGYAVRWKPGYRSNWC